MQTRWRLLKNAFANLGRGGAAGFVAVVLPSILVRHMTPVAYGVWVLVLQAAAYINYLDFGLQTAIGRYLAYANEKCDIRQRDSIFSTAFAGLIVAAAVSLVVLVGATLAVHVLFPNIPGGLISPMRWALLIVGISIAVGLPASAWNGVFVGLQRNEIPAIITGFNKLVSAGLIVWAALAGKSLVWMALAVAAPNLSAYLVQYICIRRVAPELMFKASHVRRESASELFSYCMSLTVWSFSMQLVIGVDLIIVGRVEFSALTPYSVAASLAAFVAGIQYAIFSAMMPHAAVVQARQDPQGLGNLVLTSTKISLVLLIVTGAPLIFCAATLIKLWIGQNFVLSGAPILVVLLFANMIRLIGVPYSVVLVGTGQQRVVMIGPLLEGFTNLFASLVLGTKMGAIGVAWGTLVGAVVGMIALVFYSIPKTNSEIQLGSVRYLLSAILVPLLYMWPILAVMFWSLLQDIPNLLLVSATIVSIVPSGAFFFRNQIWRRLRRPLVPERADF